MPGATSLVLRYPWLDDVVTSLAQKTLADDIDAALAVDTTALNSGLRRPSGRATRSANLNIAASTHVIPTWATEVFDTDTMINLGTNNDRMTVKTAGLWCFGATLTPNNWGTTTTAWELSIFKNSAVTGRKKWFGSASTPEPSNLTVTAAALCAVNDIIQVDTFRFGTGTAVVAAGTFWAALMVI